MSIQQCWAVIITKQPSGILENCFVYGVYLDESLAEKEVKKLEQNKYPRSKGYYVHYEQHELQTYKG